MNNYVFFEERSFGSSKKEKREDLVGKFPYVEFFGHHVLINGVKLKDKKYKLKAGDHVSVCYVPGGGDGLISGVVQVIVGVALLFVPGGQQAGAALIISGVAQIAASLLLKAPKVRPGETTDPTEQRPEITGARNTISDSIIPVVFGRTKVTPFYGQQPYRQVQDGSSTNSLWQYFVAGYNNLSISDEKLGETRITDYSTNLFTRQFAFGTGQDISNPSVKPVAREEQLSYDAKQQVNQSTSIIYNETVNNATVDYDFILEFTNVTDLGQFSDKTFKVSIDYYKNGDTSTLLTLESGDIAVNSGNIVLQSGTTYRFFGNYADTLGGGDIITTLLETRISATSQTRNNTTETAEELNIVAISEDVTIGGFNVLTPLNQEVNNYIGVISEILQTSPENTTDIDIIFKFPQGLYRQTNTGARIARSINIEVNYKNQTDIDFTPIGDAPIIYVRDANGVKQDISTTNTVINGDIITITSPEDLKIADELHFRTIGISLPSDKYTFRIRTADFVEKNTNDIGYAVVSEFNFYLDEPSVDNFSNILDDVIQLNIKTTAYTELSGVLEQYNFIGTSRLPIWNGTDWDTIAETRNPASIIRYQLTNALWNVRQEPTERIDNDSLVELYQWCEQEGYYMDGVISEDLKIQDLIETLLNNCQATWTFYNGKYVFVIDNTKFAREMFTMHNTFNFKWSPLIGKRTDALRISYVDNTDFRDDEVDLYYYNGDVFEQPEAGKTDLDYEINRVENSYITDRDTIIKLGSYILRNIQERRDLFEFDIGLESLNLKLFDNILVSNTANMETSSSGNIKDLELDSGNIIGFRLKTYIDIPKNATVTIRSLDQVNQQMVIQSFEVANYGIRDIIRLKTPIVNNGVIKGEGVVSGINDSAKWDYDGDMFEIGVGSIKQCIVEAVRWKEKDLTATIIAREV